MLKAKTILKRAIVVVAAIIAIDSEAQDLKTALLEMQKAWSGAEKMHIAIAIEAYEDENSTMAFFVQKADIKKSGDDYLYVMEDMDMLMNSKYLVVVDHAERVISCRPRSKASKPPTEMLPMADIDSILAMYKDSHYMGEKSGVKHFRTTQISGIVGQIDLYIDAKSYILKEMHYRYRQEVFGQQHFVKIKYEKFDINPKFIADLFDERHFIMRDKNMLMPSEKYKGYIVYGD